LAGRLRLPGRAPDRAALGPDRSARRRSAGLPVRCRQPAGPGLRPFRALAGRYARVVSGGEETVSHAAITPDGQSLVSLSNDGIVRVWSLSPEADDAARIVLRDTSIAPGYFAIDPESRQVAVPADGGAIVVSLAGGKPRRLTGANGGMSAVAFSEDGRRVAAAPAVGATPVKVVH